MSSQEQSGKSGLVFGARNLGDRHMIEASHHEKPHRLVGDHLAHLQLLRLPQSHSVSVTRLLQLQK